MPGLTSRSGATPAASIASATCPRRPGRRLCACPADGSGRSPTATACSSALAARPASVAAASPSRSTTSRSARSALPSSAPPASRTCTTRGAQPAALARLRALATSSSSACGSATAISRVMRGPPPGSRIDLPVLRPGAADGACRARARARHRPARTRSGALSTSIPTSTPPLRRRRSNSARAPRNQSGTRTRFHAGGRCGSMSRASWRRCRPAKPMTAACQRPPMVAMCRPRAALPMLSARSIAAAILKSSTASSTAPRRAATAAWMPGLSELPWLVMGS